MTEWAYCTCSADGTIQDIEGTSEADRRMSKAQDRKSVMFDALHNYLNGIDEVVVNEDYEAEDETDIGFDMQQEDFNGIDAHVRSDDDVYSVSFKSRGNKKRDLDQLDLPLRESGRAGNKSVEWDKFSNRDKDFPDFLVYGLFNINTWYMTETISEVVVIDTDILRAEYFRDKVPVSDPLSKKSKNDKGQTRFLDMDYIRYSSDSAVWHRKYHNDRITKGESGIDEDMDDAERTTDIDSGNNITLDGSEYKCGEIVQLNDGDYLVVKGRVQGTAKTISIDDEGTTVADYDDDCEGYDDVYKVVYLSDVVDKIILSGDVKSSREDIKKSLIEYDIRANQYAKDCQSYAMPSYRIGYDVEDELAFISRVQDNLDVNSERKGVMLVCQSEPDIRDGLDAEKFGVNGEWYITHANAKSIIEG